MENDESQSEQSPASSNKKRNIIITILAIVLAGSLGYNIYQSKVQPNNEDQLKLSLQNSENTKTSLQQQLDELKQQYESAKIQMEKTDPKLAAKQDSIIKSKEQEIQRILSKNNASRAELSRAQGLIADLKGQVVKYQQQIAVLTKKNDSLMVANDTLQRVQTRTVTKLAQVTDKSNAQEKRIQTTFSISNYQIEGLKVKKSGKVKEKERAKAVNKLHVSFDVDPNMNASGPQEIYIALYKPDGSLGHFASASGGDLTTNSGATIGYSDIMKFNYQTGSKQNLAFDWEDKAFAKGVYKIDLYQNGFKIGQKSLTLR